MNNKTYYPYFDYVRFVAASVVMFGHSGVITLPHMGSIAVEVFFAMSGWLIGGILLNLKKEDLLRFYFNRAVRIWIPYFFALFLIVGVGFLKDDITVKWFEIVFYKLTFVYNIFGTTQLAEFSRQMPLEGTGNHFWSVNAEEQFYLIAPLLLVLLNRAGRHPVLWIALSLLSWWLLIYPSIFVGVLAAVLANRYGDFYKDKYFKLCMILILSGTVWAYFKGVDYRVISPGFAIAIILLLTIQGQPNKVSKFLGGMSYPLYLNHWIGVFAANFLIRNSVFNDLLAFTINYIVIAFLYILIDRQCLASRGQWFEMTRAKAIVIIAYGMVLVGVIGGILLS